ncbi:MAG: asparagine synthase (glutamine-hydrolyzing) [Phycisphaerales bacterium]|nr:asparagine synthase (glutamine-hydrolyzing) [Phycisphaerales bacterium]
MCGIIGYFGNFDRGALQVGLDRITHRGPDDSGTYFPSRGDSEASIGLGHRRLSILDLSPLGHQPMMSPDGKVVLVFNGEIYNFQELRTELESKGHRFKSQSDTEVLLALYLHEGASMLERLNGIFAFAMWDARDQSLFVARDALGVKPLYYSTTSRGFACASEIKGLLPLVPEARELDPVALHRYLSFNWCPGEGTPLRAVRKVLPGEAMVIRAGRIERKWIWYRLPPFRGVQADLDETSAIEGTVAHLRTAVKRQLIADVPVGAFLSGGLDSSSIVAFAREQNPAIRCFTIEATGGIDAGETDDLPYAQRVAKHLGVALDIVHIDSARMAGDLERMIVQLDEPLADPAPLNVLYISQLAREHGMKVLLSGAGGDDLFTGYRRHVAANYESLWSWIPGGLRRGIEGMSMRLDQRIAWQRRLNKLCRGAGLDDDARVANYFAWARESDLMQLYSPQFKAELGSARATDPMLDFLRPLPESVGRLDRMLTLEQQYFLADHNLPYTDKMSMAVGVEVRVPFLDLDLVEFAARIPMRLKQRGRVGKWVLKRAMESSLPHDVIYRPKSGFTAPLRRWMRRDFKPLLGDLLSAESINRRGLFDAAAVQRLIADNDSGRVDASYTLLSLLGIEVWCRNYIDQRATGASS